MNRMVERSKNWALTKGWNTWVQQRDGMRLKSATTQVDQLAYRNELLEETLNRTQ